MHLHAGTPGRTEAGQQRARRHVGLKHLCVSNAGETDKNKPGEPAEGYAREIHAAMSSRYAASRPSCCSARHSSISSTRYDIFIYFLLFFFSNYFLMNLKKIHAPGYDPRMRLWLHSAMKASGSCNDLTARQ